VFRAANTPLSSWFQFEINGIVSLSADIDQIRIWAPTPKSQSNSET
jgi:hypothetical protein